MQKKVAIVLFNLGGPGNLQEVKPFLFNLFYDKAIINLPNPFRFLLAKFISSKRESTAIEIYEHIGKKSPILENTELQAEELRKRFPDYKVFVDMRYSSPGSKEVVSEIKNYDPEEIILLPLYPQFSTTTTGSSLERFAKEIGEIKQLKMICCYPDDDNFIDAHVKLIEEQIKSLNSQKYRILFTAHGLPEMIIKKGDPYQYQVELSCAKIVKKLDIKELDFKICYQSKVGRLKWIEPSTEDEIIKGSKEGKILAIVPIAFVSEHSETLVELDIEYKEVASSHNCMGYIRVKTLSLQDLFIESLAKSIEHLLAKESKDFLITNISDQKKCPNEFCKCIFNMGNNYV